MTAVPSTRILLLNDKACRPSGEYVLYWMVAFRRRGWNFALQRAAELARQYNKPLLVFEALRCDYRWANDRIHRFIIDGMVDNHAAFASSDATYLPYVEPRAGEGRGLMRALADRAVAVVTDDFPCFFLPAMVRRVASRVPVAMEAIDSNGLYPMRCTNRIFSRAHYFRRHLQKELLPHLNDFPLADPLAQVQLREMKIPDEIEKRWVGVPIAEFHDSRRIAQIPVNHAVAPAPTKGGSEAARELLRAFIDSKLSIYDQRNQPQHDVGTGLSAHLHFGHISAHEIFHEVRQREQWTPQRVAEKPNGSAHGWWGMGETAEGLLDQLITWRELGYNMCWQREDYDQYESLPPWAQQTLSEHEADDREFIYSLEQFEAAETHDELWNAAQRQLLREGRIHNYLRMLWGKKILQWTPNAPTALEVMIELNNKYALDGRNPNSYSGIFWILGRYDRAWGPERPVFGKIRYMCSRNTARKVKVKDYLQKYSADPNLF